MGYSYAEKWFMFEYVLQIYKGRFKILKSNALINHF